MLHAAEILKILADRRFGACLWYPLGPVARIVENKAPDGKVTFPAPAAIPLMGHASSGLEASIENGRPA
jgi:hypothetical protein